MADEMRDRDLVLPPNTFAFILDSTKGKVSCYVGPYKNSLSNTDTLVIWDMNRSRFVPVADVERATQVFQMASEGQYIVLSNPAGVNTPAHPPRGMSTEAIDLDVGRQVNIAGPDAFPLWPGQVAQTIDGHHLRHNQYLLVRVLDAEQARQNWQAAVVAPQAGVEIVTSPEQEAEFTTGQLIVIQGQDVSFYIPPTGIQVVPAAGGFVREAVTLEQLEYCILLDENGDKRYVQGPNVVFPAPTEQFINNDDGTRKFKAIELNDHSGIYVKVIAPYDDHAVGEELFITGKEQAIYFPRSEHGIIRYGGSKQVHHAIAIPEGEGRYVLNRDTGEVALRRGPSMYLPDPRYEVVVLRILDRRACELFYPGNQEVVEANERRAEEAMDFDDSQRERRLRSTTRNLVTTSSMAAPMDVYAGTGPLAGKDPLQRGSSYSRPRSIVLDTKYEGAVTVNIWPGYAVMVTDKADRRRVELGPKTVLLEYDESILPLELSTGKPKDDKVLLHTAYLRVVNNQVSDRITVETKDLVKVVVDVSYRVNFEGDTPEEQQRWWALENYIKVLSDHCRSRLRNVAKRHGILEFYTSAIDIIRDSLLGTPVAAAGRRAASDRPGLTFEANGMRLFDVEVLGVSIEDKDVAALLSGAQSAALSGAIELSTAQDASSRNRELQELRRTDLAANEQTAVVQAEMAMAILARRSKQELSEVAAKFQLSTESQKVGAVELVTRKNAADNELAIEGQRQEQRIALLVAETTEHLRRVGAFDENLVGALQQFGDRHFVENLMTALGPIAAAAGITTADLFSQIFRGTPFENAIEALTIRPFALTASDNGQ